MQVYGTDDDPAVAHGRGTARPTSVTAAARIVVVLGCGGFPWAVLLVLLGVGPSWGLIAAATSVGYLWLSSWLLAGNNWARIAVFWLLFVNFAENVQTHQPVGVVVYFAVGGLIVALLLGRKSCGYFRSWQW